MPEDVAYRLALALTAHMRDLRRSAAPGIEE
jgi:hypothetical protein